MMLASWKNSYVEPRQHIKKQRCYFADKGPYSQNYGFSSSHVWMWVLDHKEGWTPKNWCFELQCWRRLLRVPWTARRTNQSILRESVMNIHWKYWCWSWNSNTLATWRTDSLEKTLMLGKIEGRRRRGQQRTRWLDGITDSMDMGLSKLWRWWRRQGGLACCSPWGRKESDMTEWLKNKNLSIFSPLIVCMCLLSLSDRMQPDWLILNSSKALIAMPHTEQTLRECLQDGCTNREL